MGFHRIREAMCRRRRARDLLVAHRRWLLSLRACPPFRRQAAQRASNRRRRVARDVDPAARARGRGAADRASGLRHARRVSRGLDRRRAALATRWSVSRDGLTWSFTLRDGARFHDGTTLTATEVGDELRRHLKPEGEAAAGAASWAALLRGVPGVIKEVRAADAADRADRAHRSRTRRSSPCSRIPALGDRARGDGRRTRPAGRGRARTASSTSAPGRIALEAVPGHWGGPPRAERLVFLEVAADEQAEAELDARALDVWFPPGAAAAGGGGALGARAARRLPRVPDGEGAVLAQEDPAGGRRPRSTRRSSAWRSTAAPSRCSRSCRPACGRGARAARSSAARASREEAPGRGRLAGGLQAHAAGRVGEGGAVERRQARGGGALDARAPPTSRSRCAPEAGRAAPRALQAGDYDIALTEAPSLGGDPHLFLFPLSTSEGAPGPRALELLLLSESAPRRRADPREPARVPRRSGSGSTTAPRRCWPTRCRGSPCTCDSSGRWCVPRCGPAPASDRPAPARHSLLLTRRRRS